MKVGYIEKRKDKYQVLIDIIDLGMLGMSPCFSQPFDTREEAKKYWEELRHQNKIKSK